MTKIENHRVADYYSQQAQSYITKVRDDNAHRRVTSERELAFVLKHVQPGSKVLEIGAGPGFFTRELVKRADSVLATDISPDMVAALQANIAAENLTATPVDVYNLDELPGYGEFDTVVCMRVLCHVDDPMPALAQLRGAIHSGGNVVFDLLNAYSFIHLGRLVKRRPLKHTKYHTVRSMRRMIAESSLEITDSFGRGYPYIGGRTLDSIGYRLAPDLAHGVGFNTVRS